MKAKFIIVWMILIIALIGGAVFLPIPLSGKYTCIYHLLLDNDRPVASLNGAAPSSGFSVENGNEHVRQMMMQEAYVSRYALFWWGSLAVLTFCIYQIKKIQKQLYRNRGVKVDAHI